MQTLNMQTASLQVTLNYSYLWLKAEFEPKAGVWSCQPSEYCSPWWPFFLHLLSLPLCRGSMQKFNLFLLHTGNERRLGTKTIQNTYTHKNQSTFLNSSTTTTPNWVCLGGWIGTAKKFGGTNKEPRNVYYLAVRQKPPRKHAIFLAARLCCQVNGQFSRQLG